MQIQILHNVFKALGVNIVKANTAVFGAIRQGFSFGGEARQELLGNFELFVIWSSNFKDNVAGFFKLRWKWGLLDFDFLFGSHYYYSNKSKLQYHFALGIIHITIKCLPNP